MPAFRYRGRPLVSYSAFKKHCSLFPMNVELIRKPRKPRHEDGDGDEA